jgi:hypothetical protein
MKVPFFNVFKFRIGSHYQVSIFHFIEKGKFAALHIVPMVEDFFVRIGCEKREKEEHKIDLQYFPHMSREIWFTLSL